ncbi:MAG: hypothetical protein H6828_10245 [Planctomycetes bacterium]|nr:hypothetical protein [Planctomycetota bacterium]
MQPLHLCATLALLCLYPTASQQREEVVFECTELQVGDWSKEVDSNTFEQQFEIVHDGQVIAAAEQRQSDESEITRTVLERDDDHIRAARIECGELVKARSDKDGEAREVSVLSGEVFVARQDDDGEVHVETTEGEPLEGELRDAALKLVEGDFDDDKVSLRDVLCDVPLEPGSPLEVSERIAQRIFGGRGESSFDEIEVALVFRGLEERDGERCGVFDLSVQMSGTHENGLDMTIEAEGELVAEYPSGRLRSMTVEGELEIEGTLTEQGVELEISGSGPMTLARTATYGHDE